MKFERHFCTAGLITGTLFFAFSLTPSLLPRTNLAQGLISGFSLAAGYGIGVFARWLWNYLELPLPNNKIQRTIKIITAALCGLLVVLFLWRASAWQNSIRSLMGMEETAAVHHFAIGLISILLFTLCIGLAKIFRRCFQYFTRKLQHYIPRRVSHLLALVLAITIFWTVINGVLFSLTMRSLDSSYQQFDALLEPEYDPPLKATRTGSPDSLLDWDNVGRQGRRFLARGPTAAEIEDFLETPALEPIRVYVGLNAADSPEEQARLAFQELKRVEAFDRSLMALITPTGTGMVDPSAIAPLEYLHRGDVASVTAQYSYLPSYLAIFAEAEYGYEVARALFEKVYDHWTTLSEDQRPDLYLHGLSLGAMNSDRSFDLYDIIDDPFQGVLWSGPPFRSSTWREITRQRRPESPPWLPRFRDDSVVRFANQEGGLADGESEWGDFRLAFLQYASDPITFFEPESFYREPEWMEPPRGHDVTEQLRWFPVVTGLQLIADMAFGYSPPGYGHNFAPEHYLKSWYQLTEPEDWTTAELNRLRNHLQ